MFDWNDEELTNIIWDEAGERDGRIDPCRDQIEDKPPILFGDPSKKETNHDTSNVGPVQQKKPAYKSKHGVELDSNSKYDCGEHATGYDVDSWPDELDPSLSDAAEADTNYTADEAIQLDNDSEVFLNPPDDREQGEFVDYSWANIGSFDDLDRIFGTHDPTFGDMSAGDADELWPSSKDVTFSPLSPTSLPIGPLRTSPDRSEIKVQETLDPSQSFISGCEKLNKNTSHSPEDVQASIDTNEHYGGKSKLFVKEKALEMSGKTQAWHEQLDEETATVINEFPDEKRQNMINLDNPMQIDSRMGTLREYADQTALYPLWGNKDKILLRDQKSDRNSEFGQLHDFCGTWSSSGSPFQQVNTQYAPSYFNPCQPLASFKESHFSGPLLTSMHANPELASSGCEVPLVKLNSLKMTPEEKIGKLRRQQQMRAIIAIQKQHQRFSNQVAVAEHSTMEGRTVEVDNNLNMNSPFDYDDYNTISMVFDSCSVEEGVLYQLKDTIAKLELQIRLCIRDSLFRLAKNAMQRQHSSDTCSSDEVPGNKDIHNHERFAGMPDAETDTNPIDRTVANLLFYRRLELSGKPAEMAESPISANSLESLVQDFFPDGYENTRMKSPQRSKVPGLYSEGYQSNRSPCLDTLENASNAEAADEGMTKNEASK